MGWSCRLPMGEALPSVPLCLLPVCFEDTDSVEVRNVEYTCSAILPDQSTDGIDIPIRQM